MFALFGNGLIGLLSSWMLMGSFGFTGIAFGAMIGALTAGILTLLSFLIITYGLTDQKLARYVGQTSENKIKLSELPGILLVSAL